MFSPGPSLEWQHHRFRKLPDYIPVTLSTICHESFELGLRDTMLCYNDIQILPEDTLGSCIFRLYVTNGDGHNKAVSGVIDVAGHRCPFLDTLDVVKHNPPVLKITTWLHPLDQVHAAAWPHFGHLEQKHLIRIRALAGEHVFLDIRPVAAASKHGDAIHDPKSS
jgi:hypothetical protein